jgi:phospholipase/lecithinase/hemolysin
LLSVGCTGSPSATDSESLSTEDGRTVYSRIVVFGDSLSDIGRMYQKSGRLIPTSPPYVGGRFSNGPVWLENLPDMIGGAPVVNYAEGGATAYSYETVSFNPKYRIVTNLDALVSDFQKNDSFGPDDLVIIWLGANDYLTYEWTKDDDVQRAVQHIYDKVDEILASGAGNVLLFNLPDLSATPYATQQNTVGQNFRAALLHNQLLADMWQNSPNQASIGIFDVNTEFNDMVNSPEKYGLTDVTTPCYSGDIVAAPFGTKIAEDCDQHLFWDKHHPTANNHYILAEKVAAFMNQYYVYEGQ